MTSSPRPTVAAIAAEKYVSLTTYTKNGEPKRTPVWIVPLGESEVGFTTSHRSWKARRLANDPRVTLRPCDQRGRVEEDAPELSGTAVVVQGARFDDVLAKVKQKYGFMVAVITALGAVRAAIKRDGMRTDAAVIVTLDGPAV